VDKNYYQDEDFEEMGEFEDLEEKFEEEEFEDLEYEFEEEGEAEGYRPGTESHHKVKRIVGILVAVAVVMGIIIYGFRLDEVQVIGNKNYTAEEIKTLIGFPENAPNTLFCYLRYLRYKVKDVPFLEDVRVRMESRNMICIEVGETNILGCLKEGSTYYYFDSNSVVQEALSEHMDSVPLIVGADVEELEVGQTISMENQTIYKGMIGLCQLLVEYDIAAKEVDIDEDGKLTVYIDDALRAEIGAPVYLDEKVTELANILPELRNLEASEQVCGVLHLENYDSTKNSIVFTKEN
jgi:cell division septal protein FtsQ